MPQRRVLGGDLSLSQRKLLIGLRRRVKEFREAGVEWTKAPPSMRRVAVSAIDDGIGAQYLREICEIPSQQLASWLSAARPRGPAGRADARGGRVQEPRVLEVVEGGASRTAGKEVGLTVWAGLWQLRLCLSARRGGGNSCCQ